MRPERYSADTIAALLLDKRIATMPEMMAALGTSVERAVFRKLSELPYRTPYSRRGRYYTLDELARFDALGLCGPAAEGAVLAESERLLGRAFDLVARGPRAANVAPRP